LNGRFTEQDFGEIGKQTAKAQRTRSNRETEPNHEFHSRQLRVLRAFAVSVLRSFEYERGAFMKRYRGMPAIREGGVNVTPLIDIVMVLIVFFMLVARIGLDTGADQRITIPTSLQGLDIQDMGNTLTLNVQPGRDDQPLVTCLVGGIVQPVAIVDPRTGKKPLLNTLKQWRYGQDFGPGGGGKNADNPEFKVIIRGDQDMGYGYLEPVLLTCAEANVKNVNFDTRKVTE
jgi:biopolymer transport protein ExbD